VYAGCSSVSREGAMFAAADEFSHLLNDDDIDSSAGMIGTGAVSRQDNAGNAHRLYFSTVSDYSWFTSL